MASSFSQVGTQTTAAVKNGSCRVVKLTKTSPQLTRRSSKFIVRAEKPAGKAEKKEPAPWSPPTLDPSTPSPIFGGSTGGLLRKAQVRNPNLLAISTKSPRSRNSMSSLGKARKSRFSRCRQGVPRLCEKVRSLSVVCG